MGPMFYLSLPVDFIGPINSSHHVLNPFLLSFVPFAYVEKWHREMEHEVGDLGLLQSLSLAPTPLRKYLAWLGINCL